MVVFMSTIVKVTSKGQLTIPMKLRKHLGISRNSHMVIDEVGDFLVLKKIEKLDQITGLFSKRAKQKKISKKELLKTLKEVQTEKWQ